MTDLNKFPYKHRTAGIEITEKNPYSGILKGKYQIIYNDVGFTGFIQANYILDTFFILGITKYTDYSEYVEDHPELFFLSERTNYEGYDVTHNGFIWLCRGTLYDKYDEWDFDMYCDEDQFECCVSKLELEQINNN